MADLVETGQFEIDGVPFGVDFPVIVTDDGFQPGRNDMLTSRSQIPGGDGIRPGRDFYGSATWSFKLMTNQDTEVDAFSAYADLAAAWPRDDVRLTVGKVSTLRYRLADRTRVVYGRGGRWTPAVTNTMLYGALAAAADFDVFDALFYDDDIQTVTIPIAPIETPLNGVIPPFITPFTSVGVNPDRAGEVVVGGESPTPLWLVFEGPVTDPQVISSTGWVAKINDTIYENDPVTMDARPWARSTTRQNGGTVSVSPRFTQLSKIVLPPGRHTLTFTGTDPTGSASVAVSWRNAHPAL